MYTCIHCIPLNGAGLAAVMAVMAVYLYTCNDAGLAAVIAVMAVYMYTCNIHVYM